MDFRERLDQSRKWPAELAAEFSCPYFSTQRGSAPVCLDLRMQGGIRKAVPYSFFTEIAFNVERGIEILTNGKRITITGRNLAKLFDYLINYRVKYIQANVGYDDAEEDDGVFVAGIKIEEML